MEEGDHPLPEGAEGAPHLGAKAVVQACSYLQHQPLGAVEGALRSAKEDLRCEPVLSTGGAWRIAAALVLCTSVCHKMQPWPQRTVLPSLHVDP